MYTLPVKTWLNGKRVFVSWSVSCRSFDQPEAINHCFALCRNAVCFFWGEWGSFSGLLRKIYKSIVASDEKLFCAVYLFVWIGMFSLWKCRMIDHNAKELRGTKSVFREQSALVRSVYDAQPQPPEGLHLPKTCVCLPDV